MTGPDPTVPTGDLGTVVDWLEGRLDEDAAAAVRRRSEAGDPDVAAAVAWWGRFQAAAALRTEPVPEGLAHRLRDLGPPLAGGTPAPAAAWRDRVAATVRAALTFDSLREPGLAAARSGADSTRQLVFTVPGLDLAVDLSGSAAGSREVEVTAQLLPEDDDTSADNVLLQAWGRAGLLADVRSDDLGRVALGRLPRELVIVEVAATGTWPALHAEVDLRT